MTAEADAEGVQLIPGPARLRLPLRVPVDAELNGTTLHAEVLGSTPNVLLLEAADAPGLPPLGTPVRLRLNWDRQMLSGRLAAQGVGGRFLVALGERAIRRSRRFSVDVSGTARGAHMPTQVSVRITDLSTGGARVDGITLPIGAEIELSFTPPGRPSPINVLGFVVRAIEDAAAPAVGVAFRLVQPSMDVLGSAPLETVNA